MKEVLRIDGEAKKLLDMIYAPMYTQILFVAIELKVFSELVEERTHNDVVVRFGSHPQNTLYLLDSLVGMGLLDKGEGLYRNTALSSKYLVKGQEMFIGDHLVVSNKTTGFDDLDIVKLVRKGPNSGYDNTQGLEAYEMFGDFTEMLKSAQRGGREIEIVTMVASLPEFAGFNKMLDLGGGPGLLVIAVVKKHPTLTAVIFDTPANIADLSATIMDDATQIEMLFSHSVPQIYASALTLFIMGVLLFMYNWMLALAAFWVVPVAVLIFVLSKKLQNKMHLELYQMKRDISDHIQEELDLAQEI